MIEGEALQVGFLMELSLSPTFYSAKLAGSLAKYPCRWPRWPLPIWPPVTRGVGPNRWFAGRVRFVSRSIGDCADSCAGRQDAGGGRPLPIHSPWPRRDYFRRSVGASLQKPSTRPSPKLPIMLGPITPDFSMARLWLNSDAGTKPGSSLPSYSVAIPNTVMHAKHCFVAARRLT